MSAKILMEISNNYQQAKLLHAEQADVMWALYLPGYALLHEYQLVTEGLMQRRVKRYITSTYHTYKADYIPESANIAELLLKGKDRRKLTTEDTKAILKQAWTAYVEWEEQTLEKYKKCAAELLASGDVSAFNLVSNIIADVKSELVYITDKQIEFNAHDYDMPEIVGHQTDYYERYTHLMQQIFKNDDMEKLHHWNSSLEPKTRWEKSYV